MSMTYKEAFEYVWQAEEAEGEQFAEWGSGATSLGYNAAEWTADYDGYRCATDPTYAEAKRVVEDWREQCRGATQHIYPDPVSPTEEIPF